MSAVTSGGAPWAVSAHLLGLGGPLPLSSAKCSPRKVPPSAN